jgi:TonB family protein
MYLGVLYSEVRAKIKMKIPIIALCVWLSVATQSESFEKQAMSVAQQVSASSLDAKLPNRPFVAWLNEVIGQEAGIVWQLSECGVGAPGRTGRDTQACAEATVLLPNGDTVIVGISVGTFKQGLIGDPAFQGAVINRDEQLIQVHRLSDLPEMLRHPNGDPRALPDLQAGPLPVNILPPTASPLLASLAPGNVSSAPELIAPDEAPPPKPPLRRSRQNSGEFVDASVIKKAKPIYPSGAKTMGVSGKVEVKVVISESGRVIEATAVSGHVALRAAAEAAARQWVYKPATLDGVPMKTESVLTFTFGPGDQ